jgi:hypothetical protein
MGENQTSTHSIGDEIPYRRDPIEKKTGSLVFDQHLKKTAGDTVSQTAAPTEDGVPKDDNPLKRGQVT